MAKKKHRCKKKRNNNQYSEYNEGGDVSYEMSEADIRTLGLLNLQILMIYITIYAYIILYLSLIHILKEDDTYYVFGSHIEAAKSTDLQNWTTFTNGYTTCLLYTSNRW